jgi:hypothetical protein
MMVSFAWLTVAGVARGETPSTCAAPYSRIQLGAAIGEVGDALAVSDLVDAQKHINEVRDRMPCLDEVVDRHLFALFARYQAVVFFYGQDEQEAARWGVAARSVEPDLRWDDKVFPLNHPARTVVDSGRIPQLVGLPDYGFEVPRGGGAFVNGRFTPRPEALEDIPALVQVFDKAQQRVDAGWQDGNRFPDRFLSDSPGDLPPPAWLVGGVSAPGPTRPAPVTKVKPEPQPKTGGGGNVPVVPIGTSIVLALVSGGSYALATSFHGQLEEARTVDQLTKARTKTNLMVVTSGVSLAGAVGVGVGGVVLAGSF